MNESFEELERKANRLKLIDEFKNIMSRIKREGIEDLMNYIESSDFFTAPASTKFHSSFEGGLLVHSMNVYNRLKYRIENDELYKDLNVSDETIAIVALLHDICKADIYTIEYRAKKINGIWTDMPVYIMNDTFPFGHGEKSAYIISKYIDLTDEEAIAIRYHMGAFVEGEMNGASNAFNKYPLALALHIADSEASSIMEKEEE